MPTTMLYILFSHFGDYIKKAVLIRIVVLFIFCKVRTHSAKRVLTIQAAKLQKKIHICKKTVKYSIKKLDF